MADQKYCNRCNAPIKWPPFVPGKKSHPLNMDGTEHNCQSQAAAAAQPKDDSRVGLYKGISRGNINLTLKNGSILVTAANEDLLKCLASPDTSIKDGMKVKITFDKDGKAKTIEPCQDQPAPANPAPQTTGAPQAQTKPPAENRTSPAATPASGEKKDLETRVAEAISKMMPTDRVGYRISLAGMVNSVVEMKKMSSDAPKTYAELEAEIKRDALRLFLWCDHMTTNNIGVQ